MAIHNGVVQKINENWGKFGIMVDGNWYNTKAEWANVRPNVGDQVTFDDGGKNYLKNLKVLKEGAGAPAPAGKAPVAASKGGYNQLGVELGHASNLAMRVTEKALDGGSFTHEPGSPEFYKFWAKQTENIYALMKGMRAKFEDGDPAYSDERTSSPVKSKPAPVTNDEDIF